VAAIIDVQALFDHYRISFDEAEPTTAQMAPTCSLQLIGQITAQSLARNLRSFCSTSARSGRGSEAANGSRAA